MSTLKRFCNREIGESVWQRSYHDHVIRGESDYLEIARYINENPAKWMQDEFYIPDPEPNIREEFPWT